MEYLRRLTHRIPSLLDNPRGVFLALFLFCLLLYGNSFQNEFLLDDDLALSGPRGVARQSLTEMFTYGQGDFYRPVGHVFLWLCSQAFGVNYAGYHAANFFFFYTVGALFFHLTEQLTKDRRAAFLTAVLYLAHPINAMQVNYITASVITTFVFLQQGSLIFFLYCLKSLRKEPYILSVICFVLALFAHEMSLIFPAFIFCAALFIGHRPVRESLALSAPYAGLSLAYFLFRLNYFSLGGTVGAASLVIPRMTAYTATTAELVGWYVSKLFVPSNIIFIWNQDMAADFRVTKAIAGITIAMVTPAVIFFLRKKGVKALAVSIFVLGLIPVGVAGFTYYPKTTAIIEPHWFYFSSIGFFMTLAYCFLSVRERFGSRVFVILLILVLSVWGYLVREQNKQWRDQETYCRYWLSLNRKNLTPYYGLGKALLKKGEFQQAIQYFREGITTTTIYNPMILADMGYAEWRAGHNENAMHYFTLVLKLDPQYAQTHYYLSQYYLSQNDYQPAIESLQRAVALYPRNEDYSQLLSQVISVHGL
jgi:tetratricopeptide (TPR) repeat protein